MLDPQIEPPTRRPSRRVATRLARQAALPLVTALLASPTAVHIMPAAGLACASMASCRSAPAPQQLAAEWQRSPRFMHRQRPFPSALCLPSLVSQKSVQHWLFRVQVLALREPLPQGPSTIGAASAASAAALAPITEPNSNFNPPRRVVEREMARANRSNDA